MASANGLSRRRHRSGSLRDSPEEDGPVELHEPARLRDRSSCKKDRDRERLSRSKRRRGDRLMHGSNRDDGGEESTEESVNDDEDDEDDDGAGPVRMLPQSNPSSFISMSNNHHQPRKSFPPAKVFRPAPPWKAADEMIGVSVPRKARSASTKRSHECWVSGSSVAGEQIYRQASTSPVRPSVPAPPTSSQAPVSPSSSNVSVRKKMKPNGMKHRPKKSSSKSSSSIQDEIEIEVAEVLYGLMRQNQGPCKQEFVTNDSIKSSGDAKSRVSSPISTSQSAIVAPPQNSTSSSVPLPAIAPKRKRPRPVKYDEENSGVVVVRNISLASTAAKAEIDHQTKTETTLPKLEKNVGSTAENGDSQNNSKVDPQLEATTTPECNSSLPELKPKIEEAASRDGGLTEEEAPSPKKESPTSFDDHHNHRVDATATKANLKISDTENQREDKLQIDLMAPPPSVRSSPDRDGGIDFATDPKPLVSDLGTVREMGPMGKQDEKVMGKLGNKNEVAKLESVEEKDKETKSLVENAESQNTVVDSKEGGIDLHLDLEKHDRETTTAASSSVNSNKLQQNLAKQHQAPKSSTKEESIAEKNSQSGSLPMPMSVASWHGGLPPMGYMAPLQGVVSMDGNTVSSSALQQPPHFLFSQPRPKRCATHCYIARTISYHQQITRMNSFWPAAAAGSAASLYGAKPPSTELHGNVQGRNPVNSTHDKGQSVAILSNHNAKEKASQAANLAESVQRKQLLIQQTLPPGPPPSTNILPAPAFIFPLSQKQAAVAAAASARPVGLAKSPTTATPGVAVASAGSSAAAGSSSAAAMSFSFPNMPANETQYLAILQNSAYPFSIPAHVGATPGYRGTHAQALPFSFYPSPMLHPSQLQQQQTPQQQQQTHQNASISSASSHKHLQTQQQRQHASSGVNGGGGNLHNFPTPKNRPSQSQQQQQNQHMPPQPHRHLDTEIGGEDSPSTADSSRASRSGANLNMYTQNFSMPIQSQNFAMMTPPPSATSNQGDNKKQSQQQSLKAGGVETPPAQPFAMSFASINGSTNASGIDISSMQNHAMPEAARQQGYQIVAATAASQAAQQKSYHRSADEGRVGGAGDTANAEEERKAAMSGGGKASSATTIGQSIVFSRPDFTDPAIMDCSARTLNLVSAPLRSSRPVMAASVGPPNSSQQQQQQMQQMLHKHNQFAAAAAAGAARNKAQVATSNGSVYSDTSMPAKLPNSVSAFPQNLVQSGTSSSPAQSPQWKNSVRATTTSSSPSMAATSSSALKSLPAQQQQRPQQSHTQISFGASPKSSTTNTTAPSSHQSPSPPMVVGSPTTSSISKSTGGSSPKTTAASTSTSTKTGGQASTLSSSQQPQKLNSASGPNQKSPPVGGRSMPSFLGNNSNSNAAATTKSQLQQHQQQMQKHALQHAQLYFSNAPYTTASAPATNSYYLQRRRFDPNQQQSQQPQSGTSTAGVLQLCPVTLGSATTTDPAKAVAAAAAAAASKGSQGILHGTNQFAAAAQFYGNPHQLVAAALPNVHSVPAAIQVKPVEQKQPAGNDNLHACWQPERK